MKRAFAITGFKGRVDIDSSDADIVTINGSKFPFGAEISRICDCETGVHLGWHLTVYILDHWCFTEEKDFPKAVDALSKSWLAKQI